MEDRYPEKADPKRHNNEEEVVKRAAGEWL